jgi:hypothetical protein
LSDRIDAIDGTVGGHMQRVRAFEVTRAAIREMPIPGETFTDRQGVDLAVSGGAMRLVEIDATGALVTRAVGCE